MEDEIQKNLPPSELDKGESLGYMDPIRAFDAIISGVPIEKIDKKHLQTFKTNGLLDFDKNGEAFLTQRGINYIYKNWPNEYNNNVKTNPRLQKFKPIIKHNDPNDMQAALKLFDSERLPPLSPLKCKNIASEYDVDEFDLYEELINRYWRYYHYKFRGPNWRDTIGNKYDSKYGVIDV